MRLVTVCPALITSEGTFVWSTRWASLSAYDGQADGSDTAIWTYSSTVESGQYTTVYCQET